MPEQVTKYRIFIGSPSDLKDDKQSIDEVIKELNITYGLQNNLVLEVLKWETHSAPGISHSSVQELINQDIGGSYDLFIGLMWLKFGTPTEKAGSGTEEEFLNAYERFKSSNESFQILFYFKNALPQSLLEINPEELVKVKNFKNRIGNENVLWWDYNTIEELHGFLRLHIPRRIKTLNDISPVSNRDGQKLIEELDVPEELGLLDYIDIYEEKFEVSTISTENIANATQWIGERIREKADEINILTKTGINFKNKQFKKILHLTAQAMNEYASRLNVEMPILFENFEEGMKAMSAVVNLSDEFYTEENLEQLLSSRESIAAMNRSINGAMESMSGFYQSVIALPRIEKEINKAKRNVANKLEALINDLKISSQLAVELISEITLKIERIQI